VGGPKVHVQVSGREAEVLAAVGANLTNAQIAGRLHLSVRTVEGHVSSLLRKYGVADRRELAALAGPGDAPQPGGVSGLPVTLTSFVGRATEQAAVREAMADRRLVTLAGPGGVGKTRLAVVVAEAVAAGFPFGATFVDLVPARRDTVPQAVAAALGVAEGPQQPLEAAIAGRLARGRSLLVLDNCEHVIDAVAELAERLLAVCPATTLLVTSRERLALPGERIVAIGPLPLGSDAERLFHDRASAADPDAACDAAAVADLCARLDGLPLAIELAAARNAALGGPGLLTGLGDYVRLLAGGRGRDVRHRSLQAVIGWSHDLLDAPERAQFRRLSVFAGSFDLAAAAAVGGSEPAVTADLLGRLVDKSLVTHERFAGRWRMLATIRAVAAAKLAEAGETEKLLRRHRQWAAATARNLGAEGFDAVADDLREALRTSPAGPDATTHVLAGALGRLTHARGFLAEARERYRQAATHAPTGQEAAHDLRRAAECAQLGHDSGGAYDLLIAAAERAGGGNGRAIALAQAVELACRCPATFAVEVPHERLCALLAEARTLADPDEPEVAAWLALATAWTVHPQKLTPGREQAEAAVPVARRSGDAVLLSAALGTVRAAAVSTGDIADAHRLSRERLTRLHQLDDADSRDAAEIEDVLEVAVADAVAVGDLPVALATATRVLARDVHGDHPHLALSVVLPTLVLNGDLDLALRHARDMWDGWRRAGCPPAVWLPVAARFAALAAGLNGDPTERARWDSRADAAGPAGVFHVRHAPLAAFVAARLGDGDPAALVEAAFAGAPDARFRSYAVAAGAELAVVAGLPDAADRLTAAAPAGAVNAWAAACLLRAAGRLHSDEDTLAAAAGAWQRIGARFEQAVTLRLCEAAAAGT
jgi:predicted ATPase/DNA-binding CsgD family transcriptional regulator